MHTYETTMTEKGEITIPPAICELLKLSTGNTVLIKVMDGMVYMSKASRLLAGFGAMRPYQIPENFQKIRESFENGIAEEVIIEMQDQQ